MRTAVRSVLEQDDPRWRLTVVDRPGVPEWFAALGDDRVRYLRNERNVYAPKVRGRLLMGRRAAGAEPGRTGCTSRGRAGARPR
jgi:hypothetical protein